MEKLKGILFSKMRNVRIVEKQTSKFMKFLSCLPPLIFYRKYFLENYITTIGSTIYWPNKPKNFNGENLRILLHEYGHAYDGHKLSWFIYGFLYLFPQSLTILSLFSLLAIWFSNWFLLFLSFLICLAPWPSWFRAKFEAQACNMEILYYMNAKIYGYIPNSWVRKRIFGIILSWRYYKPCWRLKTAKRVLKNAKENPTELYKSINKHLNQK